MKHIMDYYTITEERRTKLVAEWSRIAGEPLDIKCTRMDQPIYAYGSELACLRLYYRMKSRGSVAHSDELNKWYYSNR